MATSTMLLLIGSKSKILCVNKHVDSTGVLCLWQTSGSPVGFTGPHPEGHLGLALNWVHIPELSSCEQEEPLLLSDAPREEPA